MPVTSIFTTRNAAGDIIAQRFVYDDGKELENFYDGGVLTRSLLSDLSDVESWASLERTYDAAGNLVSSTVAPDSGDTVTDLFDAAGNRLSRTLTDTDGSAPWQTLETTFDAGGALLTREMTLDTGRIILESFSGGVRTSTRLTDAEDAEGWDVIETFFDAAGTVTRKVIVQDGGLEIDTEFSGGVVSSRTVTDPSAGQPGGSQNVRVRSEYDAAGTLLRTITELVDGNRLTSEFSGGRLTSRLIEDIDDDSPWTSINTLFNAAGQKTQVEIFRDNGSVTVDRLINTDPVAPDFTFADPRLNEDDTITETIPPFILTDADGDAISIQSFGTAGLQGVLTDNGDGSYTYDPNGQFESLAVGETATTSFTYTIVDSYNGPLTPTSTSGFGATDTGTVTLLIEGRNDAPVVTAIDAGTVTEDDAPETIDLLAGQSDVDNGDTLSVTGISVSDDLNAAVAFTNNGDGTITIDPDQFGDALNTGDSRTVTVSYSVTDGRESVANTATLTVTGVDDNGAPVANDDTIGSSVSEDSQTIFFFGDETLLANDTDPDNDTLSFTAFGPTSTLGAAVGVNPGNNFQYDPRGSATLQALARDETVVDTFTYAISDGNGGTDSATVSVTVVGVNDAASISGDTTGTVTEDGTLQATGTLTVTDVDTGEDTAQVQSNVATTYGTFSVDAGGNWTYDLDNANTDVQALDAGETLSDSFTVTSLDGTASETVTITIEGAEDNGAPVANDDTVGQPLEFYVDVSSANSAGVAFLNGSYYQVFAGLPTSPIVRYDSAGAIQETSPAQPIDFRSIFVGPDGALWAKNYQDATLVRMTSFGVFESALTLAGTLNRQQQVVYDPDTGLFYGNNVGTLQVWNQSGALQSETPLPGYIASGNPLTSGHPIAIEGGRIYTLSNGNELRVYDLSTVTLLATQSVALPGITYNLSIANGQLFLGLADDTTLLDWDTATAFDLVVPPSNGNIFTTPIGVREDAVLAIAPGALVGNDTDPENDPLLITNVDAVSASGAVLTLNVDQSVDYDPTGAAAIRDLESGEQLVDTFTYTISDGNGGTDTATVSVTVNGVNTAPVAADDNTTISANNAITFIASNLLFNDTDADTGDTLSLIGADATSALGVSLTYTPGTSIRYNPTTLPEAVALPAGVELDDTFTYTISDGNGGTDTATVTVTLRGVNDAPAITGDFNGDVFEDGTLQATGKLDVIDPDTGESGMKAQTGGATYGTFVIDAAGNWTYDLDNTNPDVQALDTGETLTDIITVQPADESTGRNVLITINGTTDFTPFSIDFEDVNVPGSNAEPLDGTYRGFTWVSDFGKATADNPSVGVGANLGSTWTNLTTNVGFTSVGRDPVRISEVDGDDFRFDGIDLSLTSGTDGNVTLNGYTDGALTWTQTVAVSAVGFTRMTSNETAVIDTLEIAGYSNNVAFDNIELAKPASDNIAAITGTLAGSVTEDAGSVAFGTLAVADADAGENFIAPATPTALYGTFSVGADNQWRYELDNTTQAVQDLNQGESLTETIAVTSADGTATENVVITINGADEGGTQRIIDFEGLSANSPIVDGYEGFDWDSVDLGTFGLPFAFESSPEFPNLGAGNTVAGTGTFNTPFININSSNGDAFEFISIDLYGSSSSSGSVTLTGRNDGGLVVSETVSLSTSGFETFTPTNAAAWTQIDELLIDSYQNAGSGDIAIDNFIIA